MTINLSYPENVEGDSQQGHYIMFTINSTTQGKLSTAGFERERGRSQVIDTPKSGLAGKKFIDSNLNAGAGNSTLSSAPRAGGLAMRPGTVTMSQAITLYMPPSVKVSYKSDYKEADIGILASAVASGMQGAIEAFRAAENTKEGVGDAASAALGSASEAVVAGAAVGAMKLADTFAPGAAALAQIRTGAIVGSKMELLFTGVGRRNFSFQFNFIPKSEKESRTVYNIVQTFKEHMLPEYLGSIGLGGLGSIKMGQGRILKIPDTFDIFYFYHSNENPFLNRISTCYLTSLDVDYGGEKYVTYEPTTLGEGGGGLEGPPPQRTSITLNFSEIETITRERAQQGF